jgi:large subunit ribosomal protein L10
MERVEKDTVVNDLKGRLARAQSLVLVDFRGLTVEADTKMRNEFRANGCEYRVVKNTLLGLAVKGTAMEAIDPLLAGPTAVAYSFEDPAVPAKIATKVAKEQEKFVVKGGFVDGKALDKTGVEALSTLPGRDELRAKLLNAAPQNFMYLLAAREEELKKAAGGE